MTKPIKLVIVDDHQMVLEGLKALLKNTADITIEGSFTRGADALDHLASCAVDVVMLDINLPGMNGFELCRIIRKKFPLVKIIAPSTHNERSTITRMIQNGASGYLLKSATDMELENAIRAVFANSLYFGDDVQQAMTAAPADIHLQLPKLTRREKEILSLVAEGKTTVQMAEALSLSPLTVETHRRNMMQKFDVSTAAGLIKIALEHGLI